MKQNINKVYVIGSTGMVGAKVFEYFNRAHCDVVSVGRRGTDIPLDLLDENFDSLLSQVVKNDSVIFLAAISSPDKCEKEFSQAWHVNVVNTSKLIEQLLILGVRVLFASSDVVYGNTSSIVSEGDEINPFGKYAKMKAEVEQRFLKDINFKCFRLSYVLSYNDKFISYIQQCEKNNIEVEIFHPFSRNVIFIDDVVVAIFNLVKDWEIIDYNLLNICGEKSTSRLEMANYYNEIRDNKIDLKILEPKESFWLNRPKNILIMSNYLKKLLGRNTLDIKNSINNILTGKIND